MSAIYDIFTIFRDAITAQIRGAFASKASDPTPDASPVADVFEARLRAAFDFGIGDSKTAVAVDLNEVSGGITAASHELAEAVDEAVEAYHVPTSKRAEVSKILAERWSLRWLNAPGPEGVFYDSVAKMERAAELAMRTKPRVTWPSAVTVEDARRALYRVDRDDARQVVAAMREYMRTVPLPDDESLRAELEADDAGPQRIASQLHDTMPGAMCSPLTAALVAWAEKVYDADAGR